MCVCEETCSGQVELLAIDHAKRITTCFPYLISTILLPGHPIMVGAGPAVTALEG